MAAISDPMPANGQLSSTDTMRLVFAQSGKDLCFITPRYKERFTMMYYRFNRKDPKAQANIRVALAGNRAMVQQRDEILE